MSSVDIKNITKYYNSIKAIKNIELSCKQSFFTVIFGPSAAGKSTILKLVSGIVKPDSGSIFFDDKDITSLDAQYRNVSMAFESYALYPHLSVQGTLEFSMRAPGRTLPVTERKRRFEAVAHLLEIEELLNRMP